MLAQQLVHQTFLLSDRVRGFSGVDTPLAGVAATEEGDVLSKVPAGILALEVRNSPNKKLY